MNRISRDVMPGYQLSLRNKYALIHLLISGFIALLIGVLVFFIWYPYPFFELSDGLHLFFIVIGVDLVCGPLFTFILTNPKKSKRELLLDLSIIAIIQIAALGFGMDAVKRARPVILSFERDKIAVLSEADIDLTTLNQAPPLLKKIPPFSMNKVGIRRAKNEKEFFESVNLSMNEGIEPSARPGWWTYFADVLPEVKQKMVPVIKIDKDKMNKIERRKLDRAIQETGLKDMEIYFLPLTSKHTQDWIVLLDKSANFLGYVNINGFNLLDTIEQSMLPTEIYVNQFMPKDFRLSKE